MRKAIPIVLSPEEKLTLQNLQRSRTAEVRRAERAAIVLLAAEGREDIEIAAELGIFRFKAGRWRKPLIWTATVNDILAKVKRARRAQWKASKLVAHY